MRQINMKKTLSKLLVFSYLLNINSPSTALAQSDFLTKFRQYREKVQASKKDDWEKRINEIDQEINKATDPEDKKLLRMAKALLAMDLEKSELAQTVFQDLLKENTNLQEYVHYYYGRLLTQKKLYSEAKTQYEKILELSPNAKMQVEAQFQLAQIALEEKNFRLAKQHLTQLEKRQRREEGYPETVYHLAKAEKGLESQANFCRWIKKLYTQYPQFHRLEKWGPNLSTDEFEGAPTQCPISNEDRRSRIKNLQWAGLGQKAFGEIQQLRNQNGSDKFEVDKLEVGYWLHEGEVKKALDMLLPYYEQRKSDIGYLNLLAVAAARSGETATAVGSYYSVYKLAPRGKFGKQALFQSAFLSYQFQDYDGAARKFQEFMKVFPKSALSRDARWQLAWIRYLRGDYQGSYNSLQALLKESNSRRRGSKAFPKDRVTYWMAMNLLRMEKYSQARPLFESLAKDQLMGYYAIAAQYRLKKIEKIAPKPLRLAMAEQSRRITRFSMIDTMIPPDDLPANGEENETEESLALKAMSSEEEATTVEASASGDGTIAVADPDATAENAVEVKPSFANPVLVKRFERARDLMILGLNDWAKWDLFDIEKKTSNREYLKNLMQEYQTVENYNRSAYIAQTYFGGQRALHGLDGVRYLWEFAYPRAYNSIVTKYSKQMNVPSELIWGIMRAESVYKKDVISPVGALGLMQVMPGTGQRVADMLKEKDFKPRSLLEPDSAVRIGTRYLQRLDKKFENNIPLIAAAYNAGPHRVESWLATFGNLEMDEFIEHIPFLETRNYVKKVTSYYQIYSVLYENKRENLAYLSESLRVKLPTAIASKETWEDI